jgi:hypothetical protein
MADRAIGLCLGLELGMAMSQRPSDALKIEPLLIPGVVDTILKTGTIDAEDLVTAWLRCLPPSGGEQPSQTAVVLGLRRSGHGPGMALQMAASTCLRPSVDPPLLRSLPIAVATIGRGLMLRTWTRRAVMTTHRDPVSLLLGFAVARLAQDLLINGDLELSLARTTQALREDAPESVIRTLRPLEFGQAVPGGEDAAAVVQAAVHSLSTAQSWDEATAQAASRTLPGDQALVLTGALAGARFGAGSVRGKLQPRLESLAESQAGGLLAHALDHRQDPLPPLARTTRT